MLFFERSEKIFITTLFKTEHVEGIYRQVQTTNEHRSYCDSLKSY